MVAGGDDLHAVALMSSGVYAGVAPEWVVDCRESHLRHLVISLRVEAVNRAMFVLHPQRKRPLRALLLTAPDPAALPGYDLDEWLSERAPQLHRIG